MAVAETRALVAPRKPVGRSRSLFRRRLILTFRNPMAVLGVAVVLFWVLMAVLGPSLRPYNYSDFTAAPWSPPSTDHWLGTDTLGRDIFVRIAYGARLMLLIPTTAVALAVLLGSTIGLVTGYVGGTLDNVVMRVMDIFLAFPILMLYLLVIVAIGPSVFNVLVAIAIAGMPGIARLVRGLTIELRNREFIAAAQMRGESSAYILFREILPNASGPILVDACVRIAYAMFATGSLGFLGLGVPPPTPDWGQMISDGRTWVFKVPWAPVAPLIAISSVVIALNMIADAMRKAGWVD